MNFQSYVIRNVDGEIDMAATLSKFQDDLLIWEKGKGEEQKLIMDTLNKVFDRYKGANLNITYIVSESCRLLNIDSYDESQEISGKIKDFIKENTGTLFLSQKGRNGGFKRMVDA